MRYSQLAPLAVAAVLLVGVACSDDADDRAAVTSRTTNQPDDGSATTVSQPQASTTEAAATGGDESSDSGDASTPEPAPRDQRLDIEQRNPYGVTLKVSGLSFDEGDIFVDAELVNGSTYDTTITTWDSGYQLRLVDDAGQTYNYVEAEGEQDTIDLTAGESVQGTFAFRGPLNGQPDQISLVMGVFDEEIAGFDVTDESVSAYSPAFVVPFDLTWD